MVLISSQTNSQINQMMAALQQAKTDNSPFDSTTNEGWGANAALNKGNGVFAYTKETTTGNTISGDDDKKLSTDSALAFSEITLRSIDTKAGNSDGKVTIAEFNKNTATKLGATLDTNADGLLSRAELTSYNLLLDKLDGNMDGKINPNSSKFFTMLTTLAPERVKRMLDSNNAKIKDADSKFKLTAPLIDGKTGPYDEKDIVGRGANAGAAAAKLSGNKALYTDIQFLQKDSTGKLNLNSGLASSIEMLKKFDLNGDGVVSVREARMSGNNTPDINHDGIISSGEALAGAMADDKDGDGILTYSEKIAAKNADPTVWNTKVKQIYNDNKIANLEESFEMPEKKVNNKNFTQFLIQLIMNLFGFNFSR